MATLSNDLRERILKAYDRGEGTRQDIAERFDVSLGMVKKLLQQRRRTGDIAPRHRHSGRKPKITSTHKQKIRRFIDVQPDITLQELSEALDVEVTPQAVFYVLEKMGLSLKKRRSQPKS
jgi:transposase